MCRVRFIVVASMSLLCGCGPRRDERVIPPTLDADAVATAVMATVDGNRDGLLTQNEMQKVPALGAARLELDTDKNGGLSKAEVRHWLAFVRDSGVALSQLSGVVVHLHKPLANAAVRLVPERVMGPGMATATAVTDAEGRFAATIPGSRYPGVHCGFYRVEISGIGNDGKSLTHFQGDNTPLGLAVGGMLPIGGVVTFTLDEPTSRQ